MDVAGTSVGWAFDTNHLVRLLARSITIITPRSIRVYWCSLVVELNGHGLMPVTKVLVVVRARGRRCCASENESSDFGGRERNADAGADE